MIRRKGWSTPLVVVAAAAFVAAGCGESVEDAEQALCADLATLRANVSALVEVDAETSVEEFKQARQNVRDSWREVKDSAANLGDERFDDVNDAWDNFDDTLGDIDDEDSLSEAMQKLGDASDGIDDAQRGLVSGIDCTTVEAG